MSDRSLHCKEYWPFASADLPAFEQTPEYRFLQTALAEGFAPYREDWLNLGASTPCGRTALILRRQLAAPGRWELALAAGGKSVFSAYVDDCECAGNAALRWLRGGRAVEVLQIVTPHLVTMRSPEPCCLFYYDLHGNQIRVASVDAIPADIPE